MHEAAYTTSLTLQVTHFRHGFPHDVFVLLLVNFTANEEWFQSRLNFLSDAFYCIAGLITEK